jgi:hypothetical protein
VSRKPEGFCNLAGAAYTAPMQTRLYSSLALLALALGAPLPRLPAAEMTALALVKEGDKFIAPEAKDKITQIHSEKSTGGMVPDVWYIGYFDPTTAFKETEVKFVASKMAEVKQPKHLLDAFSGSKRLEWKKVKIDSDRALAIATNDPSLKNHDLRASQFWLERTVVGSTWKIRFWMARLGKPEEMSDIGELYISSKSGLILKNDLHF